MSREIDLEDVFHGGPSIGERCSTERVELRECDSNEPPGSAVTL